MNLNAEQLATFDERLFAGDIIAAIRAHRGFTGAQLGYAKSFVDGRLEHLRRDQPSRFPTTPSLPTPDPQILQQITPLPDRELRTFRSTLKEIEKLLYGFNYAATLSVNAAAIHTPDLPINELMLALYPESTPHAATIVPVHSEELVADVTECLKFEGDESAGPQFTDRRLKQLSGTFLPDYWRQLGALAPLESSSSYSYNSDTGLPGYYTFWFFAYLITLVQNRLPRFRPF